MPVTLNTATRNSTATSIGALFNSGTLEIRTTGGTTLLATITLPASPFGAASTGVISKSGTWSATAVASGVARLGRFISSDTLKTIEVDIAQGAGTMSIDNENVVSGGTVTVTTYSFTVPAA